MISWNRAGMRNALLFLVAILVFYFYIAPFSSNRIGNSVQSKGDGVQRTMSTTIKREIALTSSLFPLHHNQTAIMFWRPQKVGSSTILSLLVSYGYRYNAIPRRKAPMNSMCLKIAKCALDHYDELTTSTSNKDMTIDRKRLKNYVIRRLHGAGGLHGTRSHSVENERIAESQVYYVSTSHQMCNLPAAIVQSQLSCIFTNHTANMPKLRTISGGATSELLAVQPQQRALPATNVKELYIVREPLSRAISVYYFWGELYKLHAARTAARTTGRVPSANKMRLGKVGVGNMIRKGSVIQGNFAYHGNETTVPPGSIAMEFAKALPYTAGMPAPSFTWSAFANNVQSAIEEVRKDRMMTIVTERLDESLVVGSHYMGWTLADVIVIAPRKALSSHPHYEEWPPVSVQMMRSFLDKMGENALYRAANEKLDQRILQLKADGVDVDNELQLLKALRNKVKTMCLSDEYLERYRAMLATEGYQQHHSNNKLRDSADVYIERGHCFSFNSDILFTYDICGPCEAHAILLAIRSGLAAAVDDAPVLKELNRTWRATLPDLVKCPY